MSKGTTKPGDEPETGDGSAPAAAAIEPSAVAIRAATGDSDPSPDPPSVPELLERVTDIEARLGALLDDLAVALPDLGAPAPIPSAAAPPSGVYAPAPASTALESLRERAVTGDRAALLRYLRLRRS